MAEPLRLASLKDVSFLLPVNGSGQGDQNPSSSDWPPSANRAFVTTHWSLVRSAACSNTTQATVALEKLCQTYWYPLYAHVRRRGYPPEEAKDLTQEFFTRLLAGKSLANADPHKGRFRSFMLGAMDHCLADASAKARAQKRGSGRVPIRLDLSTAEQRLQFEPASNDAPDKLFDRRWASALLDQVLNRLEHEYHSSGKAALFNELRLTLIGTRESQPYQQLAIRLGLNEGAVRTAVHRLRKRYRDLIQDEISQTVSSPEEVDEEIRYLLRISSEA